MMGTFHDDKGPLHGITIVIETDGPELFVGRCFEEGDAEVVLLDVDRFESEDPAARRAYLDKAAKFGVWKKHARVAVARDRITRIRRLAEV